MTHRNELTDDQLKMIEATLKRIRGGLKKFTLQLPEPAHRFVVEDHS
jgi:hypothetical protein